MTERSAAAGGAEIPGTARPSLALGVRLLRPPTGEAALACPEGVAQLNATAIEVVQRLDGKTTVKEIVAQLAGEFEADPEVIHVDVVECLADLSGRNLVVLLP